MDPKTKELVEAAEQRAEKATPGSWQLDHEETVRATHDAIIRRVAGDDHAA